MAFASHCGVQNWPFSRKASRAGPLEGSFCISVKVSIFRSSRFLRFPYLVQCLVRKRHRAAAKSDIRQDMPVFVLHTGGQEFGLFGAQAQRIAVMVVVFIDQLACGRTARGLKDLL